MLLHPLVEDLLAANGDDSMEVTPQLGNTQRRYLSIPSTLAPPTLLPTP
ncbi:hypothetical protein QA596_08060 [Balneolales bacterium ANBcel1]|nr:hypothetical protein [Balneolales bacterium ANBcel1]